MKEINLCLSHRDLPNQKWHQVTTKLKGEVEASERTGALSVVLELSRREVAALAHALITTLEGEPE